MPKKGKKATKKAPAKSPKASPKASPKIAKKKKDPNAPKRPMSAFLLFGQERRPALKKEQPDLPFTGVGKALGAEWRAMSDAKKKKFSTAADKAKAGAYCLLRCVHYWSVLVWHLLIY